MQNVNKSLNESLQAKYPHLEISVFNFKKVSTHLIFGSEFNNNTREQALQTLNINSSKTLNDYFDLINITVSSVKESVYVYDLTHSLGNFMCDVELSNDDLGSTKKEAIVGDFVISRLRSYLQEMAVIQPKNFRQLLSTEYLVYRAKTDLLSANTLMVFALTKEIQTILNHSQYGTEHPRFYEFVLNEMPIPNALLALNNYIDLIMKKAYEILETSKVLYKEAQELLYKELELDFKNPLKSLLKSSLQAKKPSELAIINDISKKYPHLNISVRPLSKSLHKSGRLDSEYYQSKYDLMETKIKDYKGGYCKLQNLVLNYSGGFAFSSDDYLENGDLALIRINNIKNANLDMSNAVYLKKQCEKLSPKDKVKQGDILISMSGSIGLSCLIKENIEAMTNQRILKISIKDFSGDVLVLLLNSIFCKLQFERIGTGGVQTNISSNDILDILIPKINPATQEQIALKIQKSFTLRAKSKDLLQNAKIKLENAIENFCNI